MGASGSPWAHAGVACARVVSAAIAPKHRRASQATVIPEKYNAPVWWTLFVALATLVAADSERQSHTFTLPEGRAISIEVTVGSISIEGWDRPDAVVEIERHGPSREALTRLPVVIDESPSRVQVLIVQQGSEADPELRADVRVRLPRRALIERVQILEGKFTLVGFEGSVSADVRRGGIEARNVAGTVRLETGIGDVKMTGARLSAGGLLRLRTFNGDVQLTLAERPVDARLLVLALNGPIQSTIPLVMRDTWGPRWGEATLGRGEPVISIDVVTGRVEIRSP